MKIISLLGYYGTEPQSCSSANKQNSSKQRNNLEGDSEVRAASLGRKARTITSLSLGQIISVQSHETGPDPKQCSRAAQQRLKDPDWQSAGAGPSLQQVEKAGSLPQWVWKAKHQTKGDYSQALKSPGACLVILRTGLGPITPSFFLTHFWKGIVYPMPGPPLCFGNM